MLSFVLRATVSSQVTLSAGAAGAVSNQVEPGLNVEQRKRLSIAVRGNCCQTTASPVSGSEISFLARSRVVYWQMRQMNRHQVLIVRQPGR
jgi:hypothetical protein